MSRDVVRTSDHLRVPTLQPFMYLEVPTRIYLVMD